MTLRRGNPNWGKGYLSLGPNTPSEFENEMKRLRLTKETCAGSTELRIWCQKNKNRCYVPEWLLSLWDMDVDPNLGGF